MKTGNFFVRNGLLLASLWLAGIHGAKGDEPPANDKFKGLEFRELGPAVMGGRIDDFAVVESNPNIVFVGVASGGVWKTTNNGITWEPVFDKEGVSTIGDIAIAPCDPSIVWVATGEPNNRQSSSWGDGVYKSMDAGKTWQNMGLGSTHHLGRIVIHPRNPNVVYVAALGHLWGPNPERGVYKTSDGGKTWSQALKINDDTGVSDIAMDPQSPDTLYAAAYERRRTVFGYNGGGPDGAIYKSVDGGVTWKKLEKGLPYENGGDTGRIGLDIYRKNPNIVYALVQHEKGGIFRSDDRGETWKKMSDTDPRPSYYSQVRIDPNNDLRIWVLGAAMYLSEDGGKTFSTDRVKKIHGDFHALWIDPADSNHVLAGSDGGIHWSYDSGRNWDFVNTIAIGQFYEIGLDNERPYHVCGGLQDNGSWCGPVRSLTTDGIANEDWVLIHGGDGFYAQVDPVEPWIVYTESQDGELARRDLRTGQERGIGPQAKLNEPHYRFNWNSPVAISAQDHQTIFYGGNYLFKSTNRGDSWTRLDGELTSTMDRNKLPVFGKVPDKSTLSRNDGVQEYPTITTISQSPLTENVLWVGTDDGNLQVSRDGGKNWKNVASRVPGLPKGTYVSRVMASKFAEGAAYATFDGHRNEDYAIYVFLTTDYGETWKSIRNGIPDSAGSVHVIREHPATASLLFAGAEFGLWVSEDRGASWSQLKNNFPTVPVDDIQIHARENDLVLGTHGRSIWVLDDITPLEKLNAGVTTAGFTLFPPRAATLWFLRARRWSSGQKSFTANNPPYGALINYYLPEAIPPQAQKAEKEVDKDKKNKTAGDDKTKKNAAEKKEGNVKISVFDRDNKLIRQFDGPGAAGFNRVNWDLRYDPPSEPTAEQKEAMEAGYYEGPRGPGVDPGEYTIRVKAVEREASQKVTVEEDPRTTLSPAARVARRAALDELYAMAKTASADRKRILALQSALKDTQAQWKKEADQKNGVKIPENIQTQTEELLKRVNDLAKKYHREREGLGNAGPPLEWLAAPLPSQAQGLMEDIDGFAASPGQQQTEKIAELKPQVSESSALVKKLLEEDLPALNKKMNEAGVPHIVPNLDGSDASGADEQDGG